MMAERFSENLRNRRRVTTAPITAKTRSGPRHPQPRWAGRQSM